MIRLLLLTFLLLASSVNAQDLISFQENGRFGYRLGENTVIEPTYAYAFDFTNKLGLVKKGEKWGYVNELNHAVIPYEFDRGQLFHTNVAEVLVEGKMALIDTLGNFIIKPENEKFYADYSGTGYTIVNDGKKGYIPLSGNYLVPCEYVDVNGRNEYASAQREDGLWDIYGKGKLFLEGADKRMYYSDRIKGLFLGVNSVNGKYGISQMGKYWLVAPIHDKARIVSNNRDKTMFILKNNMTDGSNEIYFATVDGQLINQVPYSRADNMYSGNGFVRTKDKVGYIKNYGENVIEAIYDSLVQISVGYLAKKDGKYGVIDSVGNVLVPFKNDNFKVEKVEYELYDEYGDLIGETNMEMVLLKTGKKSAFYFPLSGDYLKPKKRGEVIMSQKVNGAIIKKKGKYGLITEGLTVRPIYQDILTFDVSPSYLVDGYMSRHEEEMMYWCINDDKLAVPHFKDEREELKKYPLEEASGSGGLHFIDGKAALYSARSGKLVTEYIFDGARNDELDDAYALLKINGKYCAYTYDGQELLPPIYDDIDVYSYELVEVVLGEESYLVDLATGEKYIKEWEED